MKVLTRRVLAGYGSSMSERGESAPCTHEGYEIKYLWRIVLGSFVSYAKCTNCGKRFGVHFGISHGYSPDPDQPNRD